MAVSVQQDRASGGAVRARRGVEDLAHTLAFLGRDLHQKLLQQQRLFRHDLRRYAPTVLLASLGMLALPMAHVLRTEKWNYWASDWAGPGAAFCGSLGLLLAIGLALGSWAGESESSAVRWRYGW